MRVSSCGLRGLCLPGCWIPSCIPYSWMSYSLRFVTQNGCILKNAVSIVLLLVLIVRKGELREKVFYELLKLYRYQCPGKTGIKLLCFQGYNHIMRLHPWWYNQVCFTDWDNPHPSCNTWVILSVLIICVIPDNFGTWALSRKSQQQWKGARRDCRDHLWRRI